MVNLNKGDTALIIDTCLAKEVLRNQCAYVLATTNLETDWTMKPIREYGGSKYFHNMYDIEGNRPAKARELGNLNPGDGVKFHGRGYVQITGRNNYIRAKRETGVDVVTNPDDVMKPELAAKILVVGMIEGWFTGRKLGHYITLQKSDFENARRIINGTDRKEKIAAIAREYDQALRAMGYGVDAAPPPDVPKPPPKPVVAPDPETVADPDPAAAPSKWRALISSIIAFLKRS